MKINVLPKEVALLIAAGEVVERPMSVVKELTENSIDAGAKNVTVEIKNGGVRYIRVADDGCGIAGEDVKTAFISHATSKIRKKEDLDAILTLGFRGEALPSIARVSKLFLLTRTEEEEQGTALTLEGGDEISCEPAGCPVGTTMIVRDLFYNTPARMKFLKKDVTEGNWVADAVTKTALSHPEVSFTFIRDEKKVFVTPGNGDLYAAVHSIFGKSVSSALIPCTYTDGEIAINGFVSKPLNNRPTRNMQYFFVNGRYVRFPAGATALDRAYQNTVMVGKFPMCFLSVSVPAETTDVNVHPTKTEIRFSQESRVFEVLYYAIRKAVSEGDRERPQVSLTGKRAILDETPARQMEFSVKNPQPVPQKEEVTPGGEPAPASVSLPSREPTKSSVPAPDRRIDIVFEDPSPTKSTPPVPPREEIKSETPRKGESAVFAGFKEPLTPVQATSGILAGPSFVSPATGANVLREGGKRPSVFDEVVPERDYASEFRSAAGQTAQTNAPELTYARVLGQVFRTYILAECGDKLLIIDKHAAHERMIFNSLAKGKNGFNAQYLLSPVSVSLSGEEFAALIENLNVFLDSGFEIEEFGGTNVLVRSCPVELTAEDVASLVQEMAGKLVKGDRSPVPEKLNWLWHSTSCRAAVKGGDEMTLAEMQSFVDRLLRDPDIRYCPHGRPVLFEMSRHELEKQFGRLG